MEARVSLIPTSPSSEGLKEMSGQKESSVRHTQLDVLRATCVIFVVGCHVFPHLTKENPLFVLNWVMQYLCLISGCLWAIARAPVLKYVGRLLIVLAIGCAFNSIPIVIRKLTDVKLYHWHSSGDKEGIDDEGRPESLARGITYAMWYLFVLIGATLALTPLKLVISKKSPVILICILSLLTLAFGVLAGMVIIYEWDLETHILKAFGIVYSGSYGLNEVPLYLVHTTIHYLTATCFLAKLRNGNSSSIAGWILLALTPALSVIMNVRRMGMFLQFFQLMVTGFFLYHVPVKFRPQLQKTIGVYWPLIAFFLVALNIDVAKYHSDQLPEEIFDRSRVALTNFLFSALFAVCWCPCLLEKTQEEFVSASRGSI